MCDALLASPSRRRAAPAPLAVPSFTIWETPELARPFISPPCSARKRDRGNSLDFLEELADCKKMRVDDDDATAALDLDFLLDEMGPSDGKQVQVGECGVEDNDFTSQFLKDCPGLMNECIDDIHFDFSLFDNEQFNITPTRPLSLERENNMTPPLSPKQGSMASLPPFETGTPLDFPRNTSVLSMLSSRAISGMSVLSEDILDLDIIPTFVKDKDLLPAIVFNGDSRIPTPSRVWLANLPAFGALASAPTPMKTTSMPTIATRRVYAEERILSTEQRTKHTDWSQRRKKCRTGFKGFRCVAKSQAAKKKMRTNGRFGMTK